MAQRGKTEKSIYPSFTAADLSPISRRLLNGANKKSQRTRAALLEAAAKFFSTLGYHGTTLEAIAQSAGQTQSGIYYYFPTKEALADEILTIGLEESSRAVEEALAALPTDADFFARLDAAVLAHVKRILAADYFSRASIRIFHQLPPNIHAKQLVEREKYARSWLKLLQSGKRAGYLRKNADMRILRMILLGAMNGALDWYNPAGRSVEYIAAQISEVFRLGLSRPAT